MADNLRNFHGEFIYPLSFCRRSAERKKEIFFSIFRFDTRFEGKYILILEVRIRDTKYMEHQYYLILRSTLEHSVDKNLNQKYQKIVWDCMRKLNQRGRKGGRAYGNTRVNEQTDECHFVD